MLTSDGAFLADFPALPPIRLADFSTGPRRDLSSRHKSDPESASLFHREASTVVALPFAALSLPPRSSHCRDDLAYQLHSRGCRVGQRQFRFVRELPLIENQQAHEAVPECAATNFLGNSPSAMLLPVILRSTRALKGHQSSTSDPVASSAAFTIRSGRQRTVGTCDGRRTGLRAGAGAGRGGGSEFL
jgi:hypothetical protein